MSARDIGYHEGYQAAMFDLAAKGMESPDAYEGILLWMFDNANSEDVRRQVQILISTYEHEKQAS